MRHVMLCWVVASCVPSTGPAKALDDYGSSLKRHDYATAYGLMSSSFRSKVSREQYERTMKDNPREVSDTADRLRGVRGGLEISAEVDYGIGDQLRLVQEGGQWRIATNPLAFYDQSTPRAALRSFVRAYRLERWDIMLRFVPGEYRDKMDVGKMKQQFTDEQTVELMRTLENAVDQPEQPIDERGNSARMHYGEKYEVVFMREGGVWKLKDLD
jgi:hypothetical protein